MTGVEEILVGYAVYEAAATALAWTAATITAICGGAALGDKIAEQQREAEEQRRRAEALQQAQAQASQQAQTVAQANQSCSAAAAGGGGGNDNKKRKKSERRRDSKASSKEDAIEEAKRKAGDKGQKDWQDIKDPKTGENIGRRSPDGKQEWRVDPPHKDLPSSEPASQSPHVNWKDWSGGKANGSYGHVFFP